MAKHFITREAEEDIDEILANIASDSFDASLAFYDRLIDLFEMLAENPRIGRDRPELNEGLRSFPVGNYLIFYRVWAGEVAIARVIHGARDLDELLS